MKKLFVLFAAATLFVGVQACKSQEEAPAEETTEVAAEEAAPAADATVADSTVAATDSTTAAK